MTAPYTYRRYLDDSFNDRMREKPARDRWCVRMLMKSGDLAPSHYGAATRFIALVERGQGQGSSGAGERVDGGGADPHARKWDAALCAREAECAAMSVASALMARAWNTEPQRLRRGRVLASFYAAVSFPHRNLSEAMTDAGWTLGGKQREAFIAHLSEALDHLVTYFDSVDAQAARENARGPLETRYKSVDTFR